MCQNILCLCFLFLLGAMTHYDTATPAARSPSPKSVIIRTVNAKTDIPVWWLSSPGICVGSAKYDACIAKKGNLFGDVHVDVSHADLPTITVSEDFVSCSGGGTYSIDEIISHGIVAENNCGKTRRQPKPGVLVIYVTPMSFKELWNM
jgi:hypothetical protein